MLQLKGPPLAPNYPFSLLFRNKKTKQMKQFVSRIIAERLMGDIQKDPVRDFGT